MTAMFVFFCAALIGALLFSRSVVAFLGSEMQKSIQAWLMETSKRGAALVLAEELETYRTQEDMNSGDYQRLRYILADFAADAGVLYAYYLRPVPDGRFQFIIDNDFNEATRVGLDTALAEVAVTPGMAEAIAGRVSTTDLGSYMSGWDGLLSAYAPILDKEGQVVAVCGVDINDQSIVGARQREISLGYLMIAATVIVLSSGAFCFFGYWREAKRAQKAKSEIEEFAHAVVSTGSGYYRRMDEMHDKLRELRHDYKYHLSAARGMLRGGGLELADGYLEGLEQEIVDTELPKYCQNHVVNALVANYAERCRELDISFDTDIGILHTLSAPNYELCVIIGNLLENAVEASEKLRTNRMIELAARTTDTQFILMVKNRFSGDIHHAGGTPVSRKANGGVGLRSVSTVATRYGGGLHTEWDRDIFNAFVTVRV
jgi:hypothetical protein